MFELVDESKAAKKHIKCRLLVIPHRRQNCVHEGHYFFFPVRQTHKCGIVWRLGIFVDHPLDVCGANLPASREHETNGQNSADQLMISKANRIASINNQFWLGISISDFASQISKLKTSQTNYQSTSKKCPV